MRNYKKITVSFNLDDEYDRKMYDYLMNIKYKTAYIKKLVEGEMNK